MWERLEITNTREYILAYLSACGELGKNIAGELPYSDSYIRKELKAMREEKIIHFHKYSDGKRYYRLCEPNGTNALEILNRDFEHHLTLMVGPRGERYKGAKERRLKQRRVYDICQLMLSSRISVDGFDLVRADEIKSEGNVNSWSKNSVFLENGNLKNVYEIFSGLNYDRAEFITTKALRKVQDQITIHPRTHMYRAVGILAKGTQLYNVYSLGGANDIWWKDAETQLAIQMQRNFNRYLKEIGKAASEKRAAIFFLPSADITKEFILNTKKRVRINPTDIYNLVYAIPIKENAGDIARMLLVDDWKNRLNKLILGAEPGKSGAEDGWTEDETSVFNMLCCNIGRLKSMAGRITYMNSIVIIHDWMEEIAKELYGNKANLIIVNSEQFRMMLNALEGNVEI